MLRIPSQWVSIPQTLNAISYPRKEATPARRESISPYHPQNLIQLCQHLLFFLDGFEPLCLGHLQLLLQVFHHLQLVLFVVLQSWQAGNQELDLLFFKDQIARELKLSSLEDLRGEGVDWPVIALACNYRLAGDNRGLDRNSLYPLSVARASDQGSYRWVRTAPDHGVAPGSRSTR